MEIMSIGEVARRAGVRPSALRYYEGVGLLPLPERTNGRRRYDGEVLREVLDRLAIVRVAQQAGFTISEIRTLLNGYSEDTPPSERWRLLAEEKLPEVEALVERALGMKDLLERGLRCECLRLEDCALVSKKPQTHSRSRAPSSYSPNSVEGRFSDLRTAPVRHR